MNETTRPTLHVIAGPNGAGKTTLYRNRVEPATTGVEFVNADEMAMKAFGHPAATKQESELGQQLAEDRRRQLMRERKSLVTESTFSHPSKLDLIKDAQAQGYEVVVYHVNVRSPQLSVMRVADRVSKGGHPVPEDKIRQRYDRNQPLIREAAKMADRAYIFDNSQIGKPHELAAVMERGKAVRLSENVPAWARVLYQDEFRHFSQARQHRAAASFAEATAVTKAELGDQARTYVARPGSSYTGQMLGETDLHLVQQIGPKAAIAHVKEPLGRVKMGVTLEVRYNDAGAPKVRSEQLVEADRRKAEVFRSSGPEEGVKQHPDLASAYAYIAAVKQRLAVEPAGKAMKVIEGIKTHVAARIERGEGVPAVERQEQAKDHGQDR